VTTAFTVWLCRDAARVRKYIRSTTIEVVARKGGLGLQVYLFLVCLAAQSWAGYYLGWFLFFAVLLLGLGALCLARPRKSLLQHIANHQTAIIGAGCLALVLITAPAYHYLSALRVLGPRPFSDVAEMIPRLQSWLYLGGASWLYAGQGQFEFFNQSPTNMNNISALAGSR
jgi:glucan phosphoethanolaminetransferase (alkaline phosphatase superfamily)